MRLNRIYYLFKPIIPWRVRVAMRRLRGRLKRTSHADVWPIDQKAGAVPNGWPGWPEGKRFALILTHDVEGSKGLTRVEQLMNLEMKYDFRSSFNFVPEWEYRLPDTLRQTVDGNGFEVGVHGLEHDGKLYDSKVKFASKAVRISQYVQSWNASGFRSPMMQHRLSWLHQLGVEYDASTFDTDPFEPEPDGVGTIFPFWVPGPNGSGYVELPYTLPQDFTLFSVLRESNIDIWKQKLDWIAERGGMALLNTHPDYMCFEGEKARDEFPASYYEDFLRYAREKYDDSFWTGQPRDIARFYCASVPESSRNSRKKICMLTYSIYEVDNRVRRYAEALAKRGDHVDVIALSRGNSPLGTEIINGVTVHRIQSRNRNERNKWTYVWRLFRFLFSSSAILARRHHRIRYDLIHIHNPPDFMVLAGLYPKMTGAKLILDIHDIVPELFASKFGATKNGQYVRLLKTIEKMATASVDHVIVSNHLWHEKLIARVVPEEKTSVIVNHVDPAIFHRRRRSRNDGKFIVLFPGTFQWHQGIDLAIEAFAGVKQRVPNAEFHIYGDGTERAKLVRLTEQLKLTECVKFFGYLPLEQIAEVMSNADLGVVPKRANSFGNEAYSTKIMEFMSQGVPVVISRTKIDSFYFDNSVVEFFTSGDIQSLTDAIMRVVEDKARREELIRHGYEYVDRNSWASKERDYYDLVDSLSVEVFDNPGQPVTQS
jgi:glycosyltransferase involved in cell wall biosynthesis/peptidoglycan/xylan/chitin deacetylase (PgdA/CDA1 family)